jgi:hypothetical protein
MKTSEHIVEYSQTHDFEDTVLMFLSQVVHEAKLNTGGRYEGKWTFRDGSAVRFKEEIFTEA